MLNKNAETRLFTSERKAEGASVAAPEPYSPFADAWKEFDTLQNAVQGRSLLRVAGHAALLFVFLLGLFGFHPSSHVKYMVSVALGVIVVADIWYSSVMKKHFQHWRCPRCHSEWPGQKNKKDLTCKTCGLRLHQLSP
jgi:hypothetical protein